MVPPADHGQVVGAQKRDLLQEITEQERVGSDHPSQRRDQGDSLKVEGAIGKEPLDLSLAHSLNVRVGGFTDVIIIPDNNGLLVVTPGHPHRNSFLLILPKKPSNLSTYFSSILL